SSKRPEQCPPPLLLRAEAGFFCLRPPWLTPPPASVRARGCDHTESRSLSPIHRDAASVPVQSEAYRVLPSISVALPRRLFLFAILLLARRIFPLTRLIPSQVFLAALCWPDPFLS